MLGLGPMDAWMEEAGVTMRSAYISANADVIAKLRRPGGVTWDLVGTFNGLVRRLEDLVHPISPDEVPLSNKIHPIFNVLPVEVDSTRATGSRVHVVDTDATLHVRDVPPDIWTGWISMRPETLRLTEPDEADIVGKVTDISFQGAHVVWRVAVGDHEVRVHGTVSEDGLARSDEVVGIKLDPKWVRFLED